jgi:radical SAM superfamily enzyme YgiQ (UPF0313 family)
MTENKKVILVFPRMPENNFGGSVSPGLLSIAGTVSHLHPDLEINIWDERISGDFNFDGVENALVGISCMTAQVPRAKSIAIEARHAGAACVVLGGIHPTVRPEEIIPYGTVVIGETEGGSFAQILDNYVYGRTQKKVYETPTASLDALPLAPSDLYRYADKGYDHLLSNARGCPVGCSFCSVHLVAGKKIRTRPVDDILHEMEKRGLLDGTPGVQVSFTSDNFGYSSAEWELLRRLRDRLDGKTFSWFAQIGLKTLANREFLELINSFTSVKAAVGIESSFRTELSREKSGANRIDPIDVFDTMREYDNIRTWALMMLGFDFEPADAFEQTSSFISRLKPDGAYISVLTPFPGTRIAETLEAQGRIKHREWTLYDTRHLVFERHFRKRDGGTGVMPHQEYMDGYHYLQEEMREGLKTWSRFENTVL